jgi:hypothetical protein
LGSIIVGARMPRILFACLLLLELAGCGEDEPAAPPAGAGPSIRTVDIDAQEAGCEAGETILNAYCYVKPGGSVSASSVVFREGDDGTLTASCLSGGRSIRIFCVKE